jgi:hypothetical protein
MPGQPYQDTLFRAIEDSSILLIVWSSRVRDMKGNWKEWVIVEREKFRADHPNGSIVYLLLDADNPAVDAHTHNVTMLRGLRGAKSPANAKTQRKHEKTCDQVLP